MPGARTVGRTVVGLDIEPGFIAAVQVRTGADGLAVERAVTAPLAPGVLRDGEVADGEALADALRELFRAGKLSKRVRLGVANQRIVVRTIDLPPLQDAKEIAAAVRFHAQDHIPMPLEQAVLEHSSLGIVETADGPRTRVVVVAARRDMIERLYTAARQAGLRPAGIDLSAFAMVRALHRGEPGATLYVSVGGMTNLALAEGTTCVFTRVVPGGVESLAAELAERRGLTLEHARQWFVHVGLHTPLETIEGEEEIVSEARRVLHDGVRRIADEVRNSLDFYRAQAGALAAERAVLTGPAVAIPGFAEELGEAIGLPVLAGVVGEARAGAHGGVDAGALVIAAGLAVEEAPALPERQAPASAPEPGASEPAGEPHAAGALPGAGELSAVHDVPAVEPPADLPEEFPAVYVPPAATGPDFTVVSDAAEPDVPAAEEPQAFEPQPHEPQPTDLPVYDFAPEASPTEQPQVADPGDQDPDPELPQD
jgi:type IV pilus assembly protein PilM